MSSRTPRQETGAEASSGRDKDRRRTRRPLELSVPWSATDRPIPRRIVQPLQGFLHTELAAGVVILVAAVVALVWANSPLRDGYEALWATELVFEVGPVELGESLRHWVNDLLMASFFFVVGLEIKRELAYGELRDPRAAALPMLCALGGMVVPALLYTAVNGGGPGANGWGIPMATDIAFAVGVLALVGTRAPASLKIFLLTLAIVDDLGAILVIAVFYSGGLEFGWLGLAGATAVLIYAMKRLNVRSLVPYVVAAGVLWLATFESGVHATIAGVVLGMLTPGRPFHDPDAVAEAADGLVQDVRRRGDEDQLDEGRLLEAARMVNESVSPLARLEARLHPYTAFLVLPLFALANAGVELSGAAVTGILSEPVTLGIMLGLVLGKPLGIVAAAFLAVRAGWGRLPAGAGWLEMLGVSGLAGIGFTVSIFIADLAFADRALTDAAKVGVLCASLVAGIAGAGFLAARDASRHRHVPPADALGD